jgi:hypothetical protein
MHMTLPTLAFIASETEQAQEAARRLSALYGQERPEEADVIVALGGDGFMLQTLHANMNAGCKIYGMNQGTVGFLMNEYREAGLRERVAAAIAETIRPLRMRAITADGAEVDALAINEVSLLRQSYQAAKIRITIDDHVRLDEPDLRRRDGGDADGLDRLQSLGAGADPAARRAASGAHPGERVPAAALARGPDPQPLDGALRRAGGRQAAGQRGGRPHRGEVGRLGDDPRDLRRDGHDPVRRQPLLGRAHPGRAVPLLNGTSA